MGNCPKSVLDYSFLGYRSTFNFLFEFTICRAEPAPPVNLQLPKINFSNAAKAAAAIVVPAEPRIRFTEKTAAPSSSGLIGSLIKREPGESEFKKRKIGEESVKKNLRTRESNDE